MPSACSRWPPVGSGALRSKTPMLSRPRKPPSKTFLPKRSLRLTHQVKLGSSFWNVRLRKSMSPRAALALFGVVDERRRPGVHRRVDVAEVPFVGRELAVGMQVALPQQQIELLLREVEVDRCQRRSSWKARSQAANQGYSHLSGIEMTSSLIHVEPFAGCATGAGLARAGRRRARSATIDVVDVELLAPQHARQRLPHDAGGVGAERGGRDRWL